MRAYEQDISRITKCVAVTLIAYKYRSSFYNLGQGLSFSAMQTRVYFSVRHAWYSTLFQDKPE